LVLREWEQPLFAHIEKKNVLKSGDGAAAAVRL
jgi:hypothetical protein